ncbi:MAG: polyprenyl synthetase family protein [Treponema sp.]|nr:polyprenyl synthetase family protein [Treponema sp.]
MNNQTEKAAPNKLDFEAGLQETHRLVQGALNSLALGQANKGLSELTAYLAQSAGKGIRTRVLLSSAMDEEGLVPANTAKAAAAVELLHTATLVHDDVIDSADTRRGRPTLHQNFGNKNAILCGDYLLSMSISMLASMVAKDDRLEPHAHLVMRFSKALASICQGEYTQHLNGGNVDLAILTYLRIITGKTAALFYISAFIGGLLGGETEDKALALGNFGRQLGMMFQIIDDCKDYELSEVAAQKPVGSDLRNGVVTLPLILALRKNPSLRKQAQAVMKSDADITLLLAQVRTAQGPELARNVAKRFEKKALRILSGLSARKREALLSILRSVLPSQKT